MRTSRRWLALLGAGVVAVVYALTLTLFASVNWLKFWDYLD